MCQHCHCRIHPQNSGEQNTSHSKRLRSLRGAESEADEMIKQEQLRPLQLSGAPQTSETIPAHPHSGFFFHHFFLVNRPRVQCFVSQDHCRRLRSIAIFPFFLFDVFPLFCLYFLPVSSLELCACAACVCVCLCAVDALGRGI